jgi:regulator of cell morphogenesis and NO signaling
MDTKANVIIPKQAGGALAQVPMEKVIMRQDFSSWSIESLVDYIVNIQHRYCKENAAIIYDLAQKVANDGTTHPSLTGLGPAMFLFLHDLLNHMKKEEDILFPNIRQLVKNKRRSGKAKYTTFGLIKEWTGLMQGEHHSCCNDLDLFSQLTNNCMLPAHSSNCCKLLFNKMKEFKAAFLMNVHLENNVLFPKALAEDEEPEEDNPVNVEFRNSDVDRKRSQNK